MCKYALWEAITELKNAHCSSCVERTIPPDWWGRTYCVLNKLAAVFYHPVYLPWNVWLGSQLVVASNSVWNTNSHPLLEILLFSKLSLFFLPKKVPINLPEERMTVGVLTLFTALQAITYMKGEICRAWLACQPSPTSRQAACGKTAAEINENLHENLWKLKGKRKREREATIRRRPLWFPHAAQNRWGLRSTLLQPITKSATISAKGLSDYIQSVCVYIQRWKMATQHISNTAPTQQHFTLTHGHPHSGRISSTQVCFPPGHCLPAHTYHVFLHGIHAGRWLTTGITPTPTHSSTSARTLLPKRVSVCVYKCCRHLKGFPLCQHLQPDNERTEIIRV